MATGLLRYSVDGLGFLGGFFLGIPVLYGVIEGTIGVQGMGFSGLGCASGCNSLQAQRVYSVMKESSYDHAGFSKTPMSLDHC